MKKFLFYVFLSAFPFAVNAQSEKERLDWSNSSLYLSLKEYCKKDFKLNDSTIFSLLDKHGVTLEEVYPSYFSMAGLPTRPYTPMLAKNNLLSPNEVKQELSQHRYNQIHLSLKTLFKNKSIEDIYKDILLQNDLPYSNKEFLDYYQQDANEEIVKELKSLYLKWKEITTNYLWEKYILAQNSKFVEIANMLDSALSKRDNRVLKDGVLKKTYGSGDDIAILEIPYIVKENELVADGLCTIHIINKQYANAKGEKFKSYTHDVKTYLNIKNGVAVSKSFSGFVKNWKEDQKVFDRASGSYVQRRAKMLEAKPVLVKTMNIEQVDDPDLIISREYLERILKFNYISDETLSDFCKQFLKNPYPYKIKEDLEKILELPVKKIDLSKLYPEFKSK